MDADEGLVKIICQMVNGSAPGPSGWTAEMVRVLTEDPDCLTGLAMLIQDITNGNLPDSIKPFLLPSDLIGLDKNAGTLAALSLLVKSSIELLPIEANFTFSALPRRSFSLFNLVLLSLVVVNPSCP